MISKGINFSYQHIFDLLIYDAVDQGILANIPLFQIVNPKNTLPLVPPKVLNKKTDVIIT